METQDLRIQKTNTTPKVIFTGTELVIAGRCIPDNSVQFFSSLKEGIKNYTEKASEAHGEKPRTTIKIGLDYLSTAASKELLDIFKEFEQLHKSGTKVLVEWYYEWDDEDMHETGRDYEAIISIPFKFIDFEQENPIL